MLHQDKILFSPCGCWLWEGALNEKGYGVCRVGRRLWKAHRLVWVQSGLPLEVEDELDHRPSCPRRCVNPSHLERVTHSENMIRMRLNRLSRWRWSRWTPLSVHLERLSA